MRKTIFYSLFSTLFLLTSCSMFEIDNYDEPAETIWGEVVDEATGKRVLTDQGSEGIRVRLTELSWGDNVQHNPDFFCMMDGTFRNTKIFKGEYNVRVDGPFIPLVRENTDGTLLYDGSVNTEISGTTKLKFEVQPFLNVEIVGNPQVSNGVVKAQVRVTRGVSDDIFREKIQPMGNWKDEYLNVTDIQLLSAIQAPWAIGHVTNVGQAASTTTARALRSCWARKLPFSRTVVYPRGARCLYAQLHV